MDYNMLVKILILTTIVFNSLAAAFAFRKMQKAGMSCYLIAWLFNVSIFVLNWIIAKEPPFGNMYHVLIAISLCFMPAFLLLKYRDRLDWLLGYFCITPVIPLLGCLFMGTELTWQRMPALQSAWFVPHVAAYVLSYSLNTVGFILCMIYYFQIFILKRKERTHNYEEAIYNVLLTAFPLMTFGMLSGALWAEEAWGGYWSWDAKETWALITWFLYLTYFHCHQTTSLKKWILPTQIFAFLALLTTFLIVNLSLIPRLKSLLHAYV
ncbi:MAG: cytochrome c biogenesis protein CcsA [Victivallaceae bacterium]